MLYKKELNDLINWKTQGKKPETVLKDNFLFKNPLLKEIEKALNNLKLNNSITIQDLKTGTGCLFPYREAAIIKTDKKGLKKSIEYTKNFLELIKDKEEFILETVDLTKQQCKNLQAIKAFDPNLSLKQQEELENIEKLLFNHKEFFPEGLGKSIFCGASSVLINDSLKTKRQDITEHYDLAKRTQEELSKLPKEFYARDFHSYRRLLAYFRKLNFQEDQKTVLIDYINYSKNILKFADHNLLRVLGESIYKYNKEKIKTEMNDLFPLVENASFSLAMTFVFNRELGVNKEDRRYKLIEEVCLNSHIPFMYTETKKQIQNLANSKNIGELITNHLNKQLKDLNQK